MRTSTELKSFANAIGRKARQLEAAERECDESRCTQLIAETNELAQQWLPPVAMLPVLDGQQPFDLPNAEVRVINATDNTETPEYVDPDFA